MHPDAKQLSRCLQEICRDPESAAEIRFPLQSSLTPWTLWLLFCLIRQVKRQRWVSSIIVSHLGVDLSALSAAGALAHPPVARSGLVPDHTDWEYFFHGRGCCLSNRITGESVDVDFYDGGADWIDDFFFVRYLASLKHPEPIELRLIQLHPTLETVGLGIGQLLENGLLQRHPDSKVFKPSDEFQDLADEIEMLNTALGSKSKRASVARLLGDWLLNCESHSDRVPDHAAAAQCLSERRQALETKLSEPQTERLALMALCDLVPNSTEYLLYALRKPPSWTTSAALDIVSRCPSEDWSEAVFELMRRADPAGEAPQPYTWTKCAEYLVNRTAHLNEVRADFSRVGRRSLGEAAIIALEHFPDLAVDLFRRALRSDVPVDRITAAAALAILDQPWCHKLLLDMLQETTNQDITAESRAALMVTRHPQLHDAVLSWERANLHELQSGPPIAMTEISRQNCDLYIQLEMEKLHARVSKLRTVIPPNSSIQQSVKR